MYETDMLDIIWSPPVPPTVLSFRVSFKAIDIPASEVKGIIENNMVSWNPDLHRYEGFNKIDAIKELRSHFRLQPRNYYTRSTDSEFPEWRLGLKESKEMVEAIYNEGVASGLYRG